MDVTDPTKVAAALSEVDTVVVVLDDPDGVVLAAAVERGLDYVDISADHTAIATGRGLHDAAVASGARAVLGIGFSPGVTNLLAASAAARIDEPSDVVVGVLLSLYDEFGPQALEMMLEAAARPYPEAGRESTRYVRPYTGARRVWFGPDLGVRKARRFPFPDQFGYPETLGVDTASTMIALDPPWLDKVIAVSARLGTLRLSSRRGARRALASILMRIRGDAGLAPVAASATAHNGDISATALFMGVGESAATAGAVAAAASLVGDIEAGVRLPEQVFDPDTFLEQLSSGTDMSISWPEIDTDTAPIVPALTRADARVGSRYSAMSTSAWPVEHRV